jgi:hypothetical protein
MARRRQLDQLIRTLRGQQGTRIDIGNDTEFVAAGTSPESPAGETETRTRVTRPSAHAAGHQAP